MAIAQKHLDELEREARTTRKFLERIPDDKLGWKPHEKSLTAGQLALHIAGLPGGIAMMTSEDELTKLHVEYPQPSSTAEVLDAFEESMSRARSLISTFDDAKMARNWRLIVDGQTVLERPREEVLRSILHNHTYHHRGQLGVYLRLMGASVPSAYGPSGDEMPEFMAASAN